VDRHQRRRRIGAGVAAWAVLARPGLARPVLDAGDNRDGDCRQDQHDDDGADSFSQRGAPGGDVPSLALSRSSSVLSLTGSSGMHVSCIGLLRRHSGGNHWDGAASERRRDDLRVDHATGPA
jgi:hypothetical protein